MKKGDIIRKQIWEGEPIFYNVDKEVVEYELEHVKLLFLLDDYAILKPVPDPENNGKFMIIAENKFYLGDEAKVQWVVDYEAGIQFISGQGMKVIDLQKEHWVIIHEAAPEYQSGVEHMTDEQLKESIELLRTKRFLPPVKSSKETKMTTSMREAPISKSEKELAEVLGRMTEESKIDLMRKLGLVD